MGLPHDLRRDAGRRLERRDEGTGPRRDTAGNRVGAIRVRGDEMRSALHVERRGPQRVVGRGAIEPHDHRVGTSARPVREDLDALHDQRGAQRGLADDPHGPRPARGEHRGGRDRGGDDLVGTRGDACGGEVRHDVGGRARRVVRDEDRPGSADPSRLERLTGPRDRLVTTHDRAV